MTELESLKKQCANIKQEYTRLYYAYTEKLIKSDIEQYNASSAEKIIFDSAKKKYVWKEQFLLSIGDATLEIEDDRSTAFLWIFDINNEYECGDWLLDDKKAPQRVEDVVDDKYIPQIQNIINTYEETIEKLKSGSVKGSHSFNNSYMDVSADNFMEVMKVVEECKI